jgi:hypothetical protein
VLSPDWEGYFGLPVHVCDSFPLQLVLIPTARSRAHAVIGGPYRIVGFFSYSREDDEAFDGTLSTLRDGIQRELSAQLGRSRATFRLRQDQAAIAPGQLWESESEIKTAVEQAVFFIPIVTPRAVNSRHCKFEFEAFLARERALGRWAEEERNAEAARQAEAEKRRTEAARKAEEDKRRAEEPLAESSLSAR